MTKTLINLLVTFSLSIILTGIMYCVWYGMANRGFEEGQALKFLLFVGDIFINTILTIASLSVLFLSNPDYNKSKRLRHVLYFGGPVLITLIIAAFFGSSWNEKLLFMIPCISFLSIQCYYYLQLKKILSIKF